MTRATLRRPGDRVTLTRAGERITGTLAQLFMLTDWTVRLDGGGTAYARSHELTTLPDGPLPV